MTKPLESNLQKYFEDVVRLLDEHGQLLANSGQLDECKIPGLVEQLYEISCSMETQSYLFVVNLMSLLRASDDLNNEFLNELKILCEIPV